MKKSALFFFMILFIGALLLAQELSTEFNSVLLETAFSHLNGDMAAGKPVEAGNTIIIPLFQVNSGFIAMSGEEKIFVGGTAGGVEMIPFSVILVSGADIRILPIQNRVPFLQQVVSALPKLIPIAVEVIKYLSIEQTSSVKGEIQYDVQLKEGKAEISEIPVSTVIPEDVSLIERIGHIQSKLIPAGENQSVLKEVSAECDELLVKYPENNDLLALKAYSSMMQIGNANPLMQMKIAVEVQNSFNKILSEDSSNFIANLGNGWMNLFNPMGKIETSISSFEKVLETDPDYLDAIYGLVQAYEKAGNKEKALEYSKIGLLLDPENELFIKIIQ